MVVNPSFPTKTFPEFITYAKANPGKLNIAMPGGVNDISGELFKIMAGVDMTNVPYRGGAPAVTDLIGGQVQVLFIGPGVIEYIRTGQLRALAVTTATRSALLPDIPTVGDFLPGFEASVWWGVGAPKNTPVEIVDKLNKEINAGLADTKIKARLADMGATPLAGSPADFGKLIADETEKWGKVIRIGQLLVLIRMYREIPTRREKEGMIVVGGEERLDCYHPISAGPVLDHNRLTPPRG
jgi:tripartite-type tricarboxylate transporter receptor subunit TctC